MRDQKAQKSDGSFVRTAEMFGDLLLHYREAAGYTQEVLARKIPCDRSLIARIEAGKRVPKMAFVERCDELLRTGGVLTRLWRKIDWYPEVEHPDWFERRARMDAHAVAVREYQIRSVPGLLQSEEYARALLSRRAGNPEEVEELVRARMSRQQRFLDPRGPLLVAVLEETCLRHVVGDASVMREQCTHLRHIGQQPNVRVHIVPFDRPEVDRPPTSMALIRMPDGHEWAYSESLERGHFHDDPSVIARHTQTYDVLRADALSASESAALISDVHQDVGERDGQQHGQTRPPHGDLDEEQLQRVKRRQLRRGGPRYPRRRRSRP